MKHDTKTGMPRIGGTESLLRGAVQNPLLTGMALIALGGAAFYLNNLIQDVNQLFNEEGASAGDTGVDDAEETGRKATVEELIDASDQGIQDGIRDAQNGEVSDTSIKHAQEAAAHPDKAVAEAYKDGYEAGWEDAETPPKMRG